MSYYRNQEATFDHLDSKWSTDTARNVQSVNDTKQTHIETQKTSTKNIEDRYYGEKDSTYQDDKKFYNPTSTNNTWIYIAGGLGALYFLTLLKR